MKNNCISQNINEKNGSFTFKRISLKNDNKKEHDSHNCSFTHYLLGYVVFIEVHGENRASLRCVARNGGPTRRRKVL